MLGKPKFKLGDSVKFLLDGNWVGGTVYIVDSFGTFEQNSEPSYDIMAQRNGEPCLFKHLPESSVQPAE